MICWCLLWRLIFILALFQLVFTLNKEDDLIKVTNRKCLPRNEAPEITMLSHNEDFNAGDGRKLNKYLLYLECTASYPIMWDFMPNGIKFTSENRVFENALNKSSHCYMEVIIIHPAEGNGRSGNYTCAGINNTMKSWKYLNIRDDEKPFISDMTDGLHKHSRLINDEEWVIPCPAAVKNFDDINLSQQLEGTNNGFMVITPHSGVRYDPYFGFLLKTSEYSRPQGSYHCVGNIAGSSHVAQVDVKNYSVFPPTNFVQYTENNTIEIICEYDEDIKLDLSEASNLKIIASSSPQTSFKYSVRFVLQEQVDQTSKGKPGKIICSTTTTKIVIHTWNHDFQKSCQCVEEISSKEIAKLNRKIDTYSTINCRVTADGSPMANFKDKIVQSSTLLHAAKQYFNTMLGNSGVSVYYSYILNAESYHLSLSYASAIVVCDVENITTVVRAVATLEGREINPDPGRFNVSKNLKIEIESDRKLVDYFSGQYINVVCSASQFYFTTPIKWSIRFQNGSIANLAPSDSKNLTEVWNMYAIVSTLNIQITENIDSITCKAPLVHKEKWESATFSMTEAKLVTLPVWNNSTGKCSTKSGKPSIILKRVPLVAETQNVLYDVTDTDLVLRSTGEALQFICQADYPIKWNLKRYLLRAGTGLKRTKFNISHDGETISSCFQNILDFRKGEKRYTQEYKCALDKDKNQSSYTYIYNNDGGSPQLSNAGEHITLYRNNNEEFTVFPCKSTYPSINVYLYYSQSNGTHRKLKTTEYESYSPKVGFTVKTSTINENSTYICSLANSTNGEGNVVFSFIVNTWRLRKNKVDDSNYKEDSNSTEKQNSLLPYLNSMKSDFKKIFSVVIAVLMIVLCLLVIQVWCIISRKLFSKEFSAEKLPLKNHLELGDYDL